MSDNLPAVSTGLLPNANEFQMLQVIAKSAQASGLYQGVGQEAKIFMVLLAARELGVSPMLALNGGIWNIQGKIEISARLMNSLIRRAGHSITIKKSDNTSCILLGKRSDGDTFECEFTIQEAAQAGLAGRDVWKKYTSDMLYNRCMSRLARRLFPDVIGNSYIEGEIREAQEVEKLPQAECEEVTKPNNLNTISSDCTIKNDIEQSKCDNSTQNDRINEQSYKELMEALEKVDDECASNFLKLMKDRYHIANPLELPQAAFDKAIVWLRANIEKNSKDVKS